MSLPDSVCWKVFRSQTHLAELQTELEEYFKANPGRLVREEGGNPNEFVGTIKAEGPIPGRFPIIIGDCLQNLRSSLDYLIWELVIASGNTPDHRNMFPICSTLEAFERSLHRDRLKGIPQDAVARIRALQPYLHEQYFDKVMLWILDDLCNINKHRRVLTTTLCGGPSDVELKIINGQTFGRVDFAEVSKNLKIGPFPIVDGPQGPGVQINEKLTIAVYLAFGEGATRNLDVGLVLAELLRHVTTAVLPVFEQFF